MAALPAPHRIAQMNPNSPVYVTQPHLPPLEEFVPFLETIWANKVLTNGGPFHIQLEQALCAYLGVQHLSLFTNATIGLVTALQALKISGEVITTPYQPVVKLPILTRRAGAARNNDAA